MPRPAQSAAVISFVDPYRGDGGKPIVLAGFLAHLAERLGPDNVHYVLIGGWRPGADRPFPVALHEVAGPSTRHRVLGLLTHSATGRAPMQEALVRSPDVAAELDALLQELAVDLEVYDTNRAGQYSSTCRRASRVCYVDDLMSVRYERMLRAMRSLPGVDLEPLGTFADQVPARLRPLATHPRVQRALLTVESRLARRSEDHVARTFDRCLLVSPVEAERLTNRAGVPGDRVLAVPPLVDIGSPPARQVPDRPEFVFLGLLSAPHNDDGLTHVLREVWPRVIARRPDARLRIIGRGARPSLIDLVSRHGGSVVLDGYVEDLGAVLACATAMIAVLRFGTGVKIKLLEALGRGLPVVSNAVGAEGVRHGDGTGVLVAESPDDLAAACIEAARPEVNRLLSQQAAAHFRDRYARPVAFAAYDAAFSTV